MAWVLQHLDQHDLALERPGLKQLFHRPTLPSCPNRFPADRGGRPSAGAPLPSSLPPRRSAPVPRSEEHTSELQSLMRISYAVFCLKKNTNDHTLNTTNQTHTQTII